MLRVFSTTCHCFLPETKKKDDNFGQNDDDWDVYKEIVSVSVGLPECLVSLCVGGGCLCVYCMLLSASVSLCVGGGGVESLRLCNLCVCLSLVVCLFLSMPILWDSGNVNVPLY